MIEGVASSFASVYDMPTSTAEEIAAAKAAFEAVFDVEMIMCYFIMSNVVYHIDGFAKNWIWTIYNGKAAPTFYDMDAVFGRHWSGGRMHSSYTTTEILGQNPTGKNPSTVMVSLYKNELDAMYKNLRDSGIVSVSHIMEIVYEWLNTQTREAVKRNLEKWTAIPSYRENGGTYPPPLSYSAEYQNDGMWDCPQRVKKWLTARLSALDSYFNYNL
jgi:hypothetical protein